MAKIILEFDAIEDRESADLALKASDYYCALWAFDNEVLRPITKYNSSPNPKIQELLSKLGDDSEELVSLLREEFYRVLKERDLDL